MAYAGWMAMGTAALAATVGIVAALEGPEGRPWLLPVLSAAVVQALVGWQLSTARNEWNAWALMTLYSLGLVIGVLRDGIWTNLIWRVVVGAVYVRGFMATVEYHELTAAIASHPVTAPSDPDALAG